MPGLKERQEAAGDVTPTGHITMTYGMWPLPGHTPYRSLTTSYHPHIMARRGRHRALPRGFAVELRLGGRPQEG